VTVSKGHGLDSTSENSRCRVEEGVRLEGFESS
jgi:hypothetical protein